MRFLFIASVLVSVAISIPAPLPSAECRAVDVIVKILLLQAATPFCSSFLSIPPSTKVVTSTVPSTKTSTFSVAIATGTAYTTTNVRTSAVTLVTSTTTLVVSTDVETSSTATTTTTTGPTQTITIGVQAKRAITIPAFLAVFASNKISSACSCLVIPTKTVTSTTVSTQTFRTTQNVAFTATLTTGTVTTTTVTSDVLSTIDVTTTTTAIATSIETDTTYPTTTRACPLGCTYAFPFTERTNFFDGPECRGTCTQSPDAQGNICSATYYAGTCNINIQPCGGCPYQYHAHSGDSFSDCAQYCYAYGGFFNCRYSYTNGVCELYQNGCYPAPMCPS